MLFSSVVRVLYSSFYFLYLYGCPEWCYKGIHVWKIDQIPNHLTSKIEEAQEAEDEESDEEESVEEESDEANSDDSDS